MAEIGEARVRITADTTNFEEAHQRTIEVMTIYALREIAFIKMMVEAKQAAFEWDQTTQRINEVISATPEDLHRMANEMEAELGAQPRQEGLQL